MSLLDFLATEAYARRRAVEGLAARDLADPAVVFALRRLLASDRDVAVRALAAGALGNVRSSTGDAQPALPGPVAWLVDALADTSPVVRDAAIRALARHGARTAYAPLRELSRSDTTWWVRRAALYAIGVIAAHAHDAARADGTQVDLHGDLAIAPARAALSDPFWRVRHAAVQVLAVSGNRDHDLRPEILADVDGSSAEYLSSLWGPTLVEDPARERIPSRLPPELLDRDPAVVTARLAELPTPPALGIVELLCDPHVPLRQLAAVRVIEANDAEAFAAALNWLDEPRIPHVAATVIAMLDSLGDPARELADRVLTTPARPGASRWAIGWVVATRDAELAELAWQRAVAIDERELALPLAPASALIEILGATFAGAGEHLAVAAADELLVRPPSVRTEILACLALHPSQVGAVRMRLAAAAGAGPHVDAALADGDALVRATALSIVGSRVPTETRHAALGAIDPAVREAVVAHATPGELGALLEVERDPWVRRAAARTLVGALRRVFRAHASQPAAHVDAAHERDARLVLALTADPDAWIRALAVELLVPSHPAHLACIVGLAADPEPMVQAAIVEQLAKIPDDDLRQATDVDGAIAAWRTAGAFDLDAQIVANHGAPSIERVDDPRPDIAPPRIVTPPPAEVARRTFGSSGIAVTPLVVSGAFDLQPGSLRAAADRGIDLFFWEPSYAAMSRFLRARRERERSKVVTGTYHADAASITKDVERALRRLRRDALDLFLLFWARSDARLDEAAFAAMESLKRAGKVRAIGFSTHDRGLAMRALDRAPWDVVMTRHSAAHPGIEAALLPHALAKSAGVLTFSALCYGRMLAGEGAPSATDCYRYSLAQPGVTACISAPRRHRELLENLEALESATLDDADLARLRAHGAGVRVESQRFNALIRQPTRDAAAAAMAMLESALAPDGEGRDSTCVTSAALQRSLGSRGRGRASLPSAMLRRGRL